LRLTKNLEGQVPPVYFTQELCSPAIPPDIGLLVAKFKTIRDWTWNAQGKNTELKGHVLESDHVEDQKLEVGIIETYGWMLRVVKVGGTQNASRS
jgi:hypothetical protein